MLVIEESLNKKGLQNTSNFPRMSTRNNYMLAHGFIREQQTKLSDHKSISFEVCSMIGGFIEKTDMFLNPYGVTHLQFSNNFTVVEKVDSADDYIDWTDVSAHFKTIPNMPATYVWYVKIMNGVLNEWGLGITDNNCLKPCSTIEEAEKFSFIAMLLEADGQLIDLRKPCRFLHDVSPFKGIQICLTFMRQTTYKITLSGFEEIEIKEGDEVGIKLQCYGNKGQLSYTYKGKDLGVTVAELALCESGVVVIFGGIVVVLIFLCVAVTFLHVGHCTFSGCNCTWVCGGCGCNCTCVCSTCGVV